MKNFLITGVLGGMGRATAKSLLDMGFNIYGIDVADTCDLPINYFKADLTSLDQINNVFKAVKQSVCSLDGIIHFAGIYQMDSLVEMNEEDFIKIFNINVFSIYRVNKTFLPLLKKDSIIIITSSELAPLDPLPFNGIYAITKSTVEKYAYSLKMELQLLGIKVSVIRPGAVKTGLLNDSLKSIKNLCDKTLLYKENTKKFNKIVNSVESKNVSPVKIANKIKKILKAKNPKFVYNINRNFLLRLLNFLPRKLQFYLIKRLLKK